jgi:hypothetical protein
MESIDGLMYLSRCAFDDRSKHHAAVRAETAAARETLLLDAKNNPNNEHQSKSIQARDAANEPVNDSASYRDKKRQCAKTFERMIYSRLSSMSRDATTNIKSTSDTKTTPRSLHNLHLPSSSSSFSNESGVKALLDKDIVPALISLTEVADIQTHVHCARALYGLSQARCSRPHLLAHNIIGTVSRLVHIGMK